MNRRLQEREARRRLAPKTGLILISPTTKTVQVERDTESERLLGVESWLARCSVCKHILSRDPTEHEARYYARHKLSEHHCR